MIQINHNGETGWFITDSQKKALDKVLEPLLSNGKSGADYNDEL